MLISNWQDYKIIKASNGQKLEKWNNIKLLRPDPIVMWNIGDILENECDAVYYRSNTGGGYWKNIKSIPAGKATPAPPVGPALEIGRAHV